MTLAVFDFDGTMIRGDSIVSYLWFARKKGLLSLPYLVRAGLFGALSQAGIVSRQRAKSAALSFRKTLSEAQKTALDQAFAKTLLKQIRPEALSAMKDHRRLGDLVVLLSASTDHYMRYVAQGLPVDRLICSTTDESGRVLRNVRGKEKVAALRELLDELPEEADLSLSTGYGDSASDLPLLFLLGRPYLVNPGRKARRKAAGRIPILSWKEIS